jgi:hypothetical protein
MRPAVARVLIECCTADQLQHFAACLRARRHIPDALAVELADELAYLLMFGGRETLGWWRRRSERVAKARAKAEADQPPRVAW